MRDATHAVSAVALALACVCGPAAAADRFEPLDGLPDAPPALRRALDAFRGQPVLVNFWASWCEPCRDEMPALVTLDEGEPGIALVTVAVADQDAKMRKFLDDYLLEPVVVADPDQAIARTWGARVLPTTILLDAAHTPRYRVRGELAWLDSAVRARVRQLAGAPARVPGAH